MSLFSRFFGKKVFHLPPSGKIEVFSRHCLFSSISAHKKRFSGFDRERCYRNLIETIDPAKANLTFFLDGPLRDHFLKDEKRYPVLEINEGSEAGSFLRLLEHVEKLRLPPDTIVYFVEDDYLHRPGWIDLLLEAFHLPIDYATLYDHRDKYFFPQYKNLKSELFITPSCHWRTVPSTTQTFAVRYRTLIEDLPVHKKFSKGRKISADHEKFCVLGKRRQRKLVSSVPGWSTHAEPEFASPCYDWQRHFNPIEEPSCPTQNHSSKK